MKKRKRKKMRGRREGQGNNIYLGRENILENLEKKRKKARILDYLVREGGEGFEVKEGRKEIYLSILLPQSRASVKLFLLVVFAVFFLVFYEIFGLIILRFSSNFIF